MKFIGKKIVYEVGDYVFVKENANDIPVPQVSYVGGMHKFLGKAVVINSIKSGDYLGIKDLSVGDWTFDPRWVRPATQEEIEKIEEPLIVGDGSYEVVIKGANLFVGCQKIEKEQFLRIGKKMEWI